MVLVWVVAAVVTVVSACGAQTPTVKRPFAVDGSVEDGPGSGLWGDGSSGPGGMHVGCIRERRFAVLITVRNRTHRKVTLLGADGPQAQPAVIERVAVQVRLAPPTPKGDAQSSGFGAGVDGTRRRL